MPLELTPEQQKLMDEADLIMERDGFTAGMEAMRKIELTPEQKAQFNKYGELIEKYGLMEPLENPESSSTEQATKSPPST
jgi:hypothetical protein